MSEKNFNIGYFLKETHFEKGFSLLKKQIEEKSYNFKCLDLTIYRNEEYIKDFDPTDFYNKYIKKDLFYNYHSAFYNISYPIPKGIYGARSFNFSSFYLQVLYYSIGFYFLDLLSNSLNELEEHKRSLGNFYTYYGGKINYDNPHKSKIFYQDDYRNFNKVLKTFIKDKIGKEKITIIKLDIQDFYRSIEHKLLFDIIKAYALPSDIRRLNYDADAIESISDLFQFIMNKEEGLPLSHQNIISNFISYIFLFDLDDFIKKINFTNIVDSIYLRYVDDFYIAFSSELTVENEIIGDKVFDIGHKISDHLLNELHLKINPLKSKHWLITTNEDFNNFLNVNKFISFSEPIVEGSKDPKIKFDEFLEILINLKKSYRETGDAKLENTDDLTLKECFMKSVKNYIKSQEAKEKLDDVFSDWNPILTLLSTKVLIYLASNSEIGYVKLREYLETNFKENINKTQYLHLLEKFISLDNYKGELDSLISSIDESSKIYFQLIKRMIFSKNDLLTNTISISDDDLVGNDTLMSQLKKVFISEKRDNYNLAFNHLLNVFHYFCFSKDSASGKLQKKYDKKDVLKFLNGKMSLKEIHFVNSFFDRRNKNTISHAGEEKMENWVVNKTEYYLYKKNLCDILIQNKI